MGQNQSVGLFRRAPDVNTALVLDACANPDIYFSKTCSWCAYLHVHRVKCLNLPLPRVRVFSGATTSALFSETKAHPNQMEDVVEHGSGSVVFLS